MFSAVTRGIQRYIHGISSALACVEVVSGLVHGNVTFFRAGGSARMLENLQNCQRGGAPELILSLRSGRGETNDVW